MNTQSQTETNQTITNQQIEHISNHFDLLKREVSKVIVGNQEAVTFVNLALLCNGHILLEGVPGIAKTTLIKTVAQALGLDFKRIQFTPDLLPADLIGSLIYNPKTQEFETKKGPVFANLILADEINRAPAKVQSALLEAMQEQQVTIGSQTHSLEKPFLVFATQNPLEQEGTYQLPEAQVDRFMFKLILTYPKMDEEKQVIALSGKKTFINHVLSSQELENAQQLIKNIYIDEKVIDYIVSIISATRKPEKYGLDSLKKFIACGASPRATLALYSAAKAYATLQKRYFVTPDDVKYVAYPILRHRIIRTFEAEVDKVSTDQIIQTILSTIACP